MTGHPTVVLGTASPTGSASAVSSSCLNPGLAIGVGVSRHTESPNRSNPDLVKGGAYWTRLARTGQVTVPVTMWARSPARGDRYTIRVVGQSSQDPARRDPVRIVTAVVR